MKLSPKKLCSKEKVGRILFGLIILFIFTFIVFIGPIPNFLAVFVAVYLIITGVLGSCLVYAIIKE